MKAEEKHKEKNKRHYQIWNCAKIKESGLIMEQTRYISVILRQVDIKVWATHLVNLQSFILLKWARHAWLSPFRCLLCSKTYLDPNLVSPAAWWPVVVLSVEVCCSDLMEKHQQRQVCVSLCDSKSQEMFSCHFIFISNSSHTGASGRGRLAGRRASDVRKQAW